MIIRITSYIDESGDYTQIILFHKLSFTSRLCVCGGGGGGGWQGVTGGCLPDPDLASLLMRICLVFAEVRLYFPRTQPVEARRG